MVSNIFIIFCALVFINLIYGIYSVKKSIYLRTIESVRVNIGVLLSLILLIYMFWICVNTHDTLDYDTYYRAYYLGRNIFEPGFSLLCNLGVKLGLEFDSFRSIIIAISFLLSFFALKRLNINRNIAFSLYAITSMTLDFIQLRNLFAFAIVLFSLPWLFESNVNYRFGKIKYLIGVFIAISIHTVSIIYLLCLLYGHEGKKYRKHKLLSTIFIFTLFGSALMKTSPSLFNLVVRYVFSFNEQKGAAYTLSSLQWGFILFWLPELIFIAISFYIKRRYEKEEGDSKLEATANRFLWINICIACAFPLCIININFFRIFRNFAIINYGLLLLLIGLPKGKHRISFILLFIANIVLLFWLNYSTNIEDTFWVFFKA